MLEFDQSTRRTFGFRPSRSRSAWLALGALLMWAFAVVAVAAPPQPTAGEGAPPAEGEGTEPPAPAPAQPTAQPPKPTTDSTKTPTARESDIYGERLDGLQAEVNDLKDRIFRSKARLAVLKETVLHGVLAGSRVIIAHRNLMSSQFKLVKITCLIDGAQFFARSDDTGALDAEDELILSDGNVVPGQHTVTIELEYRGVGFGVFSYLNGYTFESRSNHAFTAPESGALKLLAVGFERGNLTTEMKDRPAVDWQALALDSSGKPLPRAREKDKKGP